MESIRIGVANSISRNFDFDPLDTMAFAKQSDYSILQIYLNGDIIQDEKLLGKIRKGVKDFEQVYFHAEGQLNEEFAESGYRAALYNFLDGIDNANYIIHFDEQSSIDKLIRLVDTLAKDGPQIYIENFFLKDGTEDVIKNLKKYMALFTLSSNFGTNLRPVIDIPRLFNKKTGFSEEESLEWTFQLSNFFGNRRIPTLLHLIDATDTGQARSSFTALGQGVIPYDKIFNFFKKTRPALEGIILEYEDKMNPLHSREYIQGKLG